MSETTFDGEVSQEDNNKSFRRSSFLNAAADYSRWVTAGVLGASLGLNDEVMSYGSMLAYVTALGFQHVKDYSNVPYTVSTIFRDGLLALTGCASTIDFTLGSSMTSNELTSTRIAQGLSLLSSISVHSLSRIPLKGLESSLNHH